MRMPSEPTEMTALVINTTSISVEWKPPMKDKNHDFIVGYQIYLSEENSSEKLSVKPHSHSIMNESSWTYTVTDLQPNSTYQVEVAAKTSKGTGRRSSPIIVNTLGGVPSSPTLQIRLSAEEYPTVTINATWTNPSHTFGEIQAWRLRYRKRPNFCGNSSQNETEQLDMKEFILNDFEKNEYTMHDLEKGFRYEFRLAGRNGVGYGQEGFAYMTTPEGPPTGTPTKISFRFITSDSVLLTWDVPEASHCNGRILGYTVKFHKKLNDDL
ncbi:unnamed protein product [Darwinula stevensoni]|uniref:Fibronectin type-III domain-containing protein n=1 Tax=Darwinula stevensoni TaxID=69355 RepID=A0A7R8XD93_9CRUS|nr:unnamed protein product [Darwinula stevensoni]CAG0892999.1 unnamed protein product [Darwinula stevensoni]